MAMSEHEVSVTCIVCPIGCQLRVTARGREVVEVVGHLCERGERYAIDEYTAPRRVLTTTVNLQNASTRYLPVKTASPIPKELLLPCMGILKRVMVSPPIDLGDVVVKNVLGTGVDVVATRSVRQEVVTLGRS